MGVKNFSGVRRTTRGGKSHLIIDFRYSDRDGVRRRYRRDASVQLHAAAVAEAKRLMAKAAATGCVDEEPTTTTKAVLFADFVEGDFKTTFMPTYREGTRVRYEALLRQGVLDYFGKVPLDDIDAKLFLSFAARLKERGVNPRGHANFIRTVLRGAVSVGVLKSFPALPTVAKVSRKLPDAPADDEVEPMLRTATGWLRVAIGLAVFAGLRQGEVRGIEVRDIDFDGNRLLVRRALSENTEVTPKSGHDRVIPLAPELRDILADAVRSKLPRARVVVTDAGATLSRQGFLYAFKAHLKKHGLRERSFHSLRHCFCSTLIRRGASLEAVRVLAGHSNLQVTQRYVHAAGSELEGAIAMFGPRRR